MYKSRHFILTCSGLLLHGALDRGQVVLHAGVVGVELEALLVGVVGPEQVALAVECRSLAAPALGPVGLQLCRLLGILEGVVPVLLGRVGGGPVAVEDVIGGVDGDGLGELVATSC